MARPCLERLPLGTGTPEDLPFAGGTHVIVQKYLQDMAARDALGRGAGAGDRAK
jgi:hypothetical protein